MSLEPVAVLPLLCALTLAAPLAGADSRAVGSWAEDLSSFAPEWALPTYKVARFAVLAFGLIVAYPYVPGSESAAFKGVSLFIGVVFSLGSSSAIANLVAGYLMTYRRAFKVGDRVRIGDEVGDVRVTGCSKCASTSAPGGVAITPSGDSRSL